MENFNLQKLTDMEAKTEDVYQAKFLFSPVGRNTAYGGLLFAQAMRAAQKTVDQEQFFPHSIHAFFILNVNPNNPVDYVVKRLRDGRSYCTRYILAQQNENVVMSCQASFCKDEKSSIEHQTCMPDVPDPELLEDSEEFCRTRLEKYEKGEIEIQNEIKRVMVNFLGNAKDNLFEIRGCEMEKYFGLQKCGAERMNYWIKCKKNVTLNNENDHCFLVAYITDMFLASVANRPHVSNGYSPSMVVSLDHSIRFHNKDYRADSWLLYECWSPWAKYGRAFSEGRLWTRDGRLVLSVSQESLSRTQGSNSVI